MRAAGNDPDSVADRRHGFAPYALTRCRVLRREPCWSPTCRRCRRQWWQRLLDETGRWPLLLRLVNKLLAGQAGLHLDVTAAAEELLGLLRAGGRASVDELTGAAGQPLDVTDPVQRQQAVWATIQASTGLLGATECSRLAELAVFAEDETIPIPLIAALWSATGGLDSIAAGALCARLTDLALLAPSPGGGMVTMHDVIRDYHRDELGADRLAQLHEILLSIIAETLPTAAPVAGAGSVTAWWELPKDARYLRDHLIDHMLAARRAGQAEETAADLRWVGARLQASGPAGAYADLALVGTSRAERLAWVLGQVAHLLAPTDPPYSVADILYCRIGHDPDWGPQAMTLTASRAVPALASAWPPPDLPAPPLRRVIVGHTESVTAVAVAPDGTWIATGSWDKTGRIWNPVTGQQRAVLTGHNGAVTAVAIASGRLVAGHRRRRWIRLDLGLEHWPAARQSDSPQDRDICDSHCPGRDLARHRPQRRASADLGCRNRPTACCLGRPRPRGDSSGDCPGRDLARHRRRRHSPDLGYGDRPRTGRPGWP